MARPKGAQSDARERLIEAAGRRFRVSGYSGAGVDGLAKDAGLTSGAFYAHFGSKAAAFRTALVDGFEFLLGGIEQFKDRHGKRWLKPFVEFYFGERITIELAQACALPSFSTDAARADDETREAYQIELEKIIASLANGLGGPHSRKRALQLLAVLAGGAAMARAVTDERLRAEIVNAAREAAKAV